MKRLWRCCFAVAAVVGGTTGAAADTPSVEALLKAFDETALQRSDFDSKSYFVRKWTGPLKVSIREIGGDTYGPRVLAGIRRLGVLAGLDVEVLGPEAKEANYIVELSSLSGFPSANGLSSCVTYPKWHLDGRMHEVTIKISIARPDNLDRCILHEGVHAIGFIWHSHASSTILSYSHHDTDLTPLDVVLIRGLYDKRITPGMPRLAALTTAKTVFAELIGAPASTAADGYIERVIGNMRGDAEAGDSYTQIQFGMAREFGQGLPKDETAAVDWYRKAANLGNPQGEFRLGWLLHQGRGVPRDTAEAAAWYRKAAEANIAIAQNNLGVLLERGDGVPADPVEAYKWYCVAAKAQLPIAEGNKKKFAAKLSPEQIAEAERRAAEWKPKERGK